MTLNKMMIIGNLGADPELRYTPGGKAGAELPVAVNDRSKGGVGGWVAETQRVPRGPWGAGGAGSPGGPGSSGGSGLPSGLPSGCARGIRSLPRVRFEHANGRGRTD